MAETQLYVYHLQREDDTDYGEYHAHVIIADCEHTARLMAGRCARGNGIHWADLERTSCALIGVNAGTEQWIVMSEMKGE